VFLTAHPQPTRLFSRHCWPWRCSIKTALPNTGTAHRISSGPPPGRGGRAVIVAPRRVAGAGMGWERRPMPLGMRAAGSWLRMPAPAKRACMPHSTTATKCTSIAQPLPLARKVSQRAAAPLHSFQLHPHKLRLRRAERLALASPARINQPSHSKQPQRHVVQMPCSGQILAACSSRASFVLGCHAGPKGQRP
jgi:hypothetical protein